MSDSRPTLLDTMLAAAGRRLVDAAATAAVRADAADGGARMDSLANFLSGLGWSGHDKTRGSVIVDRGRLSDRQLELLYESNAYARRIVEEPVRDCVRRGVRVVAGEELEIVDDDGNREMTDEPVYYAFRRHGVMAKLGEADTWSRLYGGGVVLLITEDGAGYDEPLELATLQTVRALRVHDATEVHPLTTHLDDEGEPILYHYAPVDAGALDAVGAGTRIHASRLVIFRGAPVSRRRRLQNRGWEASVLQAAWDAIEQITMVEKGLAHLAHEADVGVFGLRGLADMVKSDEGRKAAQARLNLINQSKSVVHGILMDAEHESYQRVSANVSGLHEIWLRAAEKLCAASGMPMTRLFGHAPGGLSTDDESGTRLWDDLVDHRRQTRYTAPIERLARVMMAAKDGPTSGQIVPFTIEWPPLRQLTPAEESEVRLRNAQAAEIYWRIQAVDETEIRGGLEEDPAGLSGRHKIDPSLTPGATPTDAA